MSQICSQCSRPNPADASYCYYDGTLLAGHSTNGVGGALETQPFPRPFIFPSGIVCRNFEGLALACQQHWGEAKDLLEQGYLETFLGSLGRADLAQAARQAARFPDRDRGFDQFLSRIPGKALKQPKLAVDPLQISLGRLSVGEDRKFDLLLRNEGMRLLYGTITCDTGSWLGFGEGSGSAQKLFAFTQEVVVSVQVRGQGLRASKKPLEGRVLIESNGGSVAVVVTIEVPPKPFPDGVLAGALTPRQVAEKARETPKEAAVLLEEGKVARWYKENGWPYPIQGPTASGLGAVQQFFEALGLAQPPKVDISEPAVALEGNPGQQLVYHLEVKAQERRPVFANGISEQPWLQVGKAKLEGRTATIPLLIPSIPDRPGEVLQTQVTIIANGQQRFKVPVSLRIGGLTLPQDHPMALVEAKSAPAFPTRAPSSRWANKPMKSALVRGLPVGLLVLVLLGMILRDVFLGVEAKPPAKEEEDRSPRIDVQFHNQKKGDLLDGLVPPPSMRFGLVMLNAKDSRGQPKRLNPDSWGRTNNTCLRLDGEERLFGFAPGQWQELEVKVWKDEQGRDHPDAVKSQWLLEDRKVLVTQIVERVAGEQTDVPDTCLVHYLLENQDKTPHQVGLRFLLDTYIGANDGVPFTIPGATGLCDDQMDFNTPEKVPDFIQALENEDLANPGTVAHVKLKLGGRESPSRVTLGAWPDEALQRLKGINQAQGPNTRWDVPLLSMKTLWPYDSAVVIYWSEKPLQPGGRREVGFAYGLGSVTSSGKLLVTVDGTFKPDGELSVAALVRDPAPGETLTLTVPPEFKLEGDAEQAVPLLPAEASTHNRPVSWKVRAGPVGKYELSVKSSTGPTQTQTVTIKASSIFD